VRSFPTICALAALQFAGAAGAETTTGAIVQEVSRTERGGSRVLNLWWLPGEYWEAAARELEWTAEQIDETIPRASSYLVIGVLDARAVPGKGLEFSDHLHIVNRLTVRRDGVRLDPLQRMDPELARALPDLTYFLRASLGPLAPGVRLLLFPNVDDDGKPILVGSRAGRLSARYEFGDGAAPVEVYWRGPLTSVVGARRDPETGEPLDASWKFNPWTGQKLD
jgi:hypothetical protein